MKPYDNLFIGFSLRIQEAIKEHQNEQETE